jgi:hypothetical protein
MPFTITKNFTDEQLMTLSIKFYLECLRKVISTLVLLILLYFYEVSMISLGRVYLSMISYQLSVLSTKKHNDSVAVEHAVYNQHVYNFELQYNTI